MHSSYGLFLISHITSLVTSKHNNFKNLFESPYKQTYSIKRLIGGLFVFIVAIKLKNKPILNILLMLA